MLNLAESEMLRSIMEKLDQEKPVLGIDVNTAIAEELRRLADTFDTEDRTVFDGSEPAERLRKRADELDPPGT